jgi:hypothetical protein
VPDVENNEPDRLQNLAAAAAGFGQPQPEMNAATKSAAEAEFARVRAEAVAEVTTADMDERAAAAGARFARKLVGPDTLEHVAEHSPDERLRKMAQAELDNQRAAGPYKPELAAIERANRRARAAIASHDMLRADPTQLEGYREGFEAGGAHADIRHAQDLLAARFGMQARIDAARAEGVRIGRAEAEARSFDFSVENSDPSPYAVAVEALHAAASLVIPIDTSQLEEDVDEAADRAAQATARIADSLGLWLISQIDSTPSPVADNVQGEPRMNTGND